MLERGSGHLVAVSSVAGLVATPYRSSYSAAKAAILAFHDSLRAENHGAGLKISVVCPGFVRSNVANAAFTGDGSAAAGRFPQNEAAMPAAEFARRMANALEREQQLIVIAGKEALVWWINRISPSLAAQVMRRVKVT
jgi:dehydrogenase/reductase SDR family protein 7B